MKNKPTHFAVEDIKFYAMDEDNEIIVDEKGEQITYRLKDDVRLKPLEYQSEGMDIDIFEQLESIAKSDSNEERIMLKQFQKKDSYKELSTINQKIDELEIKEKTLSDEDNKNNNQFHPLHVVFHYHQEMYPSVVLLIRNFQNQLNQLYTVVI